MNLLPKESDIQTTFIAWCRLMASHDERFNTIFAVPNGPKLHPGTAARMVREGLSAGVPDVICLCPSSTYHGAVIEFKRPGGRLSEKQKEWLTRLHKLGYAVSVCFSVDEAVVFIENYLGTFASKKKEVKGDKEF